MKSMYNFKVKKGDMNLQHNELKGIFVTVYRKNQHDETKCASPS